MNKKYSLKAVVNGDYVVFDQVFASHTEALNAAFEYLNKNLNFDTNVMEEYEDEEKHNIEYILSNHDRFIISRI